MNALSINPLLCIALWLPRQHREDETKKRTDPVNHDKCHDDITYAGSHGYSESLPKQNPIRPHQIVS